MQVATNEKHKGITRAIILIVIKSIGFQKKCVGHNTNIQINTPSPIITLVMLVEKQLLRNRNILYVQKVEKYYTLFYHKQ